MTQIKPPSSSSVRHHRHVRSAIVQRRDEARANNEPCWLCGQEIDWSLLDAGDTTHDGFPEVDHVLPLSKFPQYAADQGNMKPAHRGCNNKRSATMTASGIGRSSRDWEALG